MEKDICVIVNAGSGQKDAKSNPDNIVKAFEALGTNCTLKLIENGAQIESLSRSALNEGFKTIVAGGGDGTICAVASALSDSDATMGILPLGTFNYYARSLNLPMELDAAVKVIVDGKTQAMRIATVNDKVFLNNASLGAYPAILETREDIYKRWGRSRVAAYWAVVKTLFRLRSSMRLRITVDGQAQLFRTPLVFVVNNAYQLTHLSVEGADRIEDGELVTFVAADSSRLELIRMALVIALRQGLPKGRFEVMSGSDILIESLGRRAGRPHKVARDGERQRLAGPYRFKVKNSALTVLIPSPEPEKSERGEPA
ncbi:diacylglycerol kinase family protein [Cypionkella sp.]|uniref:diacylglycerol/lipid kinase family protein n=1 Tax=Cypionkella sp. TaxID=2811411 RepID=UPI00262A8FD2|nr:diacylglycerol kinase family protein [Cypionkella sp.]MDB5665708.1 diacylglycerol kinase, catalytic region [Cypionkella sp.]